MEKFQASMDCNGSLSEMKTWYPTCDQSQAQRFKFKGQKISWELCKETDGTARDYEADKTDGSSNMKADT